MLWLRRCVYVTITISFVVFGITGILAYLTVFTSLPIPDWLLIKLITLWAITSLLTILEIIIALPKGPRIWP